MFGALDVPAQVEQVMSADEKAAIERQRTVLAEYEAVNLRMANEVQKTIANTRAEVEAHKKQLAERAEARMMGLEAEYAKKESELEEDRQRLAAEKAELDTRDSRHARRGTRDALLKQINASNETFTLTKDTRQKRWAVRASCYLGATVFLGLLAASYAWVAPETDMGIALALGLRTSAAVAFSALLVYYLRWESGWAQRHAEEEFYRKRLGLDINRANWVVEAAMEWAAEREEPMPGVLVASIAHGLFHEGKPEEIDHPSQQLAEMLRRAGKLNLKFGDAELELGGRDIRALDKAAKK